ncbi:hypothetical protein AB205_0184950 [Aquarana catesbeiana]|uniref:Uncharacterized protein n=1 Tax=Aquarana catesbeiana TaxID=8400 RepID=A0A2G9RLN6_AQUCT|nr:hypothetical protein AB205_0184950 [Aquarana catesbeiana]
MGSLISAQFTKVSLCLISPGDSTLRAGTSLATL